LYEIIKRIRNEEEELVRDVSQFIVTTNDQAVTLSHKMNQLQEIRNEKKKNDNERVYYIFRELVPMTDEMYEQCLLRFDRDIAAER